jgi:hypothetical protein
MDKFSLKSNNKIIKVGVEATGGGGAPITYEIPKEIIHILSHFL